MRPSVLSLTGLLLAAPVALAVLPSASAAPRRRRPRPRPPRVVVADVDSGINPYHVKFRGTNVTQAVLDEFGIGDGQIITLSTGPVAAAAAKDFAGVQRGKPYWFRGHEHHRHLVRRQRHGRSWATPGTSTGRAPPPRSWTPTPRPSSSWSRARATPRPRAGRSATRPSTSSPPPTASPAARRSACTSSAPTTASSRTARCTSAPPTTPPRCRRSTARPAPGGASASPASTRARARAARRCRATSSTSSPTSPRTSRTASTAAPARKSVSGTSFATPRSAGVASKVILEARKTAGHTGGITAGAPRPRDGTARHHLDRPPRAGGGREHPAARRLRPRHRAHSTTSAARPSSSRPPSPRPAGACSTRRSCPPPSRSSKARAAVKDAATCQFNLAVFDARVAYWDNEPLTESDGGSEAYQRCG